MRRSFAGLLLLLLALPLRAAQAVRGAPETAPVQLSLDFGPEKNSLDPTHAWPFPPAALMEKAAQLPAAAPMRPQWQVPLDLGDGRRDPRLDWPFPAPPALPRTAVKPAPASAVPASSAPVKPALASAQAAAKSASSFDGAKPKRATKLDYAEFGRLVALTPRLSTNPFRDTEAKRRILAKAGYTHLIGPGGKRIPIAIADEVRVGRAFENTLKAHARRQKKQK